jgi:hypothetical protein
MNKNLDHLASKSEFKTLQNNLEELKILQAKTLAAQNFQNKEDIISDLNKAEFKVFSQWGDDGIIQFLINYLNIENEVFIEFGVENYLESNTRFLLLNNCWKGLVMDGSAENIKQIQQSDVYWKFHLEAKQVFITKENINQTIKQYTPENNIGLLVIDVDGNDYWIWEAINNLNPTIVIIEYNSLFGYERAITIPYLSNFKRTEAHFSNLFYGASLKALSILAQQKNYTLVACNKNGNNAYFVRNDQLKSLKSPKIEDTYKKATFRESRDTQGKLTYLNFEDACQTIKGLTVYNVETNLMEQF